MLATAPRTLHPPPHPHPAAFFSHQLVYWPYPSPPVSPTTYFNQPSHSPTHVPGNHGPPMYSLDYIPAMQSTSYANPASPLSPPTVAIPTNTSSLILSPNKTPTMALVPTPKQYPVPPVAPMAAVTPTYHSKMTLHPTHPSSIHTNLYHHHYSSAPPLQTTTILAVPPPPPLPPSATTVLEAPLSGNLKTTSITEQPPLLAIDTSHGVEKNALKINSKITNSSIAVSHSAVTAKTVVVATDPTATNTTTTSNTTTPNMNGIVSIVTKHCVELYTS